MSKFTPKKILVPVDFSDFSREALEAAAGIAELRGASITVLHVMMEPQASVPYEVYIDWQKVKGEIKEDAEKMLAEMTGPASPASKAESCLEWGEPAPTIVRVAKEGNFDIIVMATHGRTGLTRLFLGSVAEQVIRHAPCPVLSFRPKVIQRAGAAGEREGAEAAA